MGLTPHWVSFTILMVFLSTTVVNKTSNNYTQMPDNVFPRSKQIDFFLLLSKKKSTSSNYSTWQTR